MKKHTQLTVRKASALLLSLAMGLSLAACGGDASSSAAAGTDATAENAQTEATDTADSGEKVHITYAFWGGEDEAANTQKTLDIFNASQDRIEVEAIPIPWETYMEKLNTMATGGQLPDCALMSEAGVLQWAEQGMLLDISDMYGPDDPQPLDCVTYTYEGKPVAYATANNSLVMFYNKDMFDAAGVEYPPTDVANAWTWDEFVDVAKQLTLDSSGLTDDGVQRSLIAGTCAMTTNGAWNIGTCLEEARNEGLNYGVAVLPYMKDKVTICTGGPNVVFSQSKHPEEAMEFIKWYSSEENSWDSLIAKGIWMPITEPYYTDEEMTKKWLENPSYPAYEESKPVLCDYVRDYAVPTSWYYTNNTVDFNALLGSVLGDVWTGKTTAREAIDANYDALVAAHDGMG
ncbi:sugar ABC transporter substrate-binding protein [Subdoligranulum variabile]|uniref:ABC transporter substrate-binding protein n=1 Tax=Subdoligranulum variabile TaxID=214851 RepID=UPI0026F31BDE|nr:sugar ABC transporter substrate-binding protein [Subdoligranulum variabile]